MPLIVKCPNGCQLRMPANRAGKIVRCPNCKSLIKIDAISKAKVTEQTRVRVSATEFKPEKKSPDANSETLPESDDTPIIAVTGKGNSDLVEGNWEGIVLEKTANAVAAPANPEYSLKTRAHRSRNDRILLAKIFAGLLCLVAVINLIPSISIWLEWIRFGQPIVLSRWMYLQIFVASLHIIYAVFLVQIPDWSALRTVAVAMLIVAFVFGTVSTGLLVGKGHGVIAGFLEIPFTMATRASIWCVAMLCLATLISYLSGREAANWRRTEQLLSEILESKSESGVSS